MTEWAARTLWVSRPAKVSGESQRAPACEDRARSRDRMSQMRGAKAHIIDTSADDGGAKKPSSRSGPSSAEPRPCADRMPPLPAGCMPRGLSRQVAAAYVGVSSTLFDRAVADGKMAKPFPL
jgi:hypothetical protein